MKRIVSFLLMLCLLVAVCSSALAAKASIVTQPESQTIKVGGTVTYTVKANNTRGEAITWHFINPATGEDVTGKKLESRFKGLQVKNPNSLSITLKKVPEEMHGWTGHCHIGRKAGGIDSAKVMVLLEGKEVPAFYASMNAAQEVQEAAQVASQLGGYLDESGAIVTPVPEPIVITGNKIDLYMTDNKDNPVGEPQSELTFESGKKASFYVKVPDVVPGSLAYVSINGIRMIPNGDARGMAIRNWPESATVKIKVNRPDSEKNEVVAEITLPPQEEISADPADLVTVTCTYCRFTGGGLTYAESGQVPRGTEITVFASGGNVKTGYTINKAKKAEYKEMASFRIVVEEDTTITMKKQ